ESNEIPLEARPLNGGVTTARARLDFDPICIATENGVLYRELGETCLEKHAARVWTCQRAWHRSRKTANRAALDLEPGAGRENDSVPGAALVVDCQPAQDHCIRRARIDVDAVTGKDGYACRHSLSDDGYGLGYSKRPIAGRVQDIDLATRIGLSDSLCES